MKPPVISLIVAVARNNAIGKNGQMLWHIPEDLRYFKQITLGKTVIMGRKTWQSLQERFRPLPGRRNIVVSHQPDYPAHGALLADSLEAAFALSAQEEEVFVIGGAQLYQQALPFAHRIYLTRVDADYEADAFFLEPDNRQWQPVASRSGTEDQSLRFIVYERK